MKHVSSLIFIFLYFYIFNIHARTKKRILDIRVPINRINMDA